MPCNNTPTYNTSTGRSACVDPSCACSCGGRGARTGWGGRMRQWPVRDHRRISDRAATVITLAHHHPNSDTFSPTRLLYGSRRRRTADAASVVESAMNSVQVSHNAPTITAVVEHEHPCGGCDTCVFESTPEAQSRSQSATPRTIRNTAISTTIAGGLASIVRLLSAAGRNKCSSRV